MKRSVVTIGAQSGPAGFLSALLADANACNIVVLESIARGYSRIKQLKPDLVVVFLGIDDVAGCQLLSMLQIDDETSIIPLITLVKGRDTHDIEDFVADDPRACFLEALWT
jgi:DNA-binding response OmpR family regulator